MQLKFFEGLLTRKSQTCPRFENSDLKTVSSSKALLKNFKFDRIILIAVLAILSISLIAQSSVAHGRFFSKQLLFILLGIPIFYLGYAIPTDLLKKSCWFIYGFSIVLLLLVLVKGSSALGAQRWISIGGFSLQPSEPAKIACIIALANWFHLHRPRKILDLIGSGLVVMLLPFGLIFIQPDLGTSLVLVAVFFSMAYWSGARFHQVLALLSPLFVAIISCLGPAGISFPSFTLGKHSIHPSCSIAGAICISLLCMFFSFRYRVWKGNNALIKSLGLCLYGIMSFLIAFIGRPLAWSFLKPYQQKRLTIFLDPQSDPLEAGYNIIQSLLAVGSGGLFGQGFKQGHLTQGQFVPEQHTDFIFSSIAEEWGFVGTGVLVLIFLIVCVRIFFLVLQIEDLFSKLLAVGILTFLSFHVCVNISMNIGIMPVVGVPLPFMSYGGTSMWVCLFSIGIIQRIYADQIANSMFK